jgi:transglutaminase-like putative cysteine protease
VSSTAQVAVLEPRGVRRARSRSDLELARRPRLKLAAFGALGLYGALRWGTLLSPAPIWRLLGLLGLAALVAGPGRALALRSRGLGVAVPFVALLAIFPMCGIRLSWVVHVRLAVVVRGIGEGLSALPNVLVPYNGINDWVRVVIPLGAGLLLLGAALILCFAPRRGGEAWRASAAVPLLVLAVLPSTLSRPQLPYLHGLILFALLAMFMWGDRIRRYDAPLAVGVSILAGAVALIAAPRIDPHHPWLDFQALAGTLAPAHIERFDFSQHYGPLNWPRTGREVLEVKAQRPDYWKVEDLDVFDGRRWVLATGAPALPPPGPAALGRWTQTIQVTLRAMQSTDVILAGTAEQPTHLAQSAAPGADAGTWTVPAGLQPGDSYRVRTYSPQPSGPELAVAGIGAGVNQLAGYRSMQMTPTSPAGQPAVVVFPAFGVRGSVEQVIGLYGADGRTLVEHSPYGRAYRLARHLAARASTPYGFIERVMGYLHRGYTYNENPRPDALPLVSFLFSTRQGYCQQFAGAMALLLRMGGVPARVVGGFTTGAYDRTAGQYRVSDLDAHAWVEAWFSGYGWVRFDPTPASAPARTGTVPLPGLHGKLGNASRPGPIRHRDITPAIARSRPGRRGAGASTPLPIVIAIVVALGLLVMAARRATLRRGPSDEAWVLELERALARTGRAAPPGLTLAALERRLTSTPEAAGYIRAVRLGRFGGASAAPTAAGRRALRAELRAGLGLLGRLRALWALPPVRFRSEADPGAPGGGIK